MMTFDKNTQRSLRRWLEIRGRRELALLLFVAWDPLGVNQDIEMWREYEMYADALAELASSAGDEVVSVEMARIADAEMGMATGVDREIGGLVDRWVRTGVAAVANTV